MADGIVKGGRGYDYRVTASGVKAAADSLVAFSKSILGIGTSAETSFKKVETSSTSVKRGMDSVSASTDKTKTAVDSLSRKHEEFARKGADSNKRLALTYRDLDDKQKRLIADFDRMLRPADQLNKSFQTLQRIGVKNSDIIRVYGKEIQQAAEAHKKFGQQLPKNIADLEKQRMQMEKASGGAGMFKKAISGVTSVLLSLGIALGAYGLVQGFRSLIDASIDFETAFTGVIKTVSGTPEELDKIGKAFRRMALEIPVSVENLSRIGELAGQLGVKKEGIESFTRTIADLGATTDLTFESAAMQLAQLSVVMGISHDKIDEVANVLVDLGNNSAATESNILALASRMTGMGKQIGLTMTEILGLAAGFRSMGINAERGGTAVSASMQIMNKAVALGGNQLREFAEISGVSGEKFARTFKENPLEAILLFVEGLAAAKKRGDDAVLMLDRVGIRGRRLTDVLLRAAGAGDKMREKTELASKALADNNAMTIEAMRRYSTAASKLQLFTNSLNELKITLGDHIVPYLTAMTDQLRKVIEAVARGEGLINKFTISLGVLGLSFAGFKFSAYIAGFGGIAAAIKGIQVAAIAGVAALGPFSKALIAAAAVYEVLAWADIANNMRMAGRDMAQTQRELAELTRLNEENAARLKKQGFDVTPATEGEDPLAYAARLKRLEGRTRGDRPFRSGLIPWDREGLAAMEQARIDALQAADDAAYETRKRLREEDEKWVAQMEAALIPADELLRKVRLLEAQGFSYGEVLRVLGGELRTVTDDQYTHNQANEETITKYKAIQRGMDVAKASAAKFLGEQTLLTGVLDRNALSLEDSRARAEEMAKAFDAIRPRPPFEQAAIVMEQAGVMSDKVTAKMVTNWSDVIQAMGDLREKGAVSAEEYTKVWIKATEEIFKAQGKLGPIHEQELMYMVENTRGVLRGPMLKLWEDYIESVIVAQGKLPKELEELNKKIAANTKATTTEVAKAWMEQVSTIVTDFSKAFAEILFEGKSFAESMIDVFREFGKSAFRTLTEQLFEPIQRKMNEMIASTVDWILSGGKGQDKGGGIGQWVDLGTSIANAIRGGGGGSQWSVLAQRPSVAQWAQPAGYQAGGSINVPGVIGAGGSTAASAAAAKGGSAGATGGGLAGFFGTGAGFASGIAAIVISGLKLESKLTDYTFAETAREEAKWGQFGATTTPYRLFTHTPVGAGRAEAIRDFGGLKLDQADMKEFLKSIGMSPNQFYDIRKDIMTSPMFLTQVAYPAAEAAGEVDALLKSLENVETVMGTVDLATPFREFLETGDTLALDKAWRDLFQNSEALLEIMPDFAEKLLLNHRAMGLLSEATQEEVRALQDAKEGFEGLRATLDSMQFDDMFDTFLATGEILPELSDLINEFGGDMKAFTDYADIMGISKDWDEMLMHFYETGEVLPGLGAMFRDFGGDLDVLDRAAKLPGLHASLGFISDLSRGLPKRKTPTESFLESGIISPEFAALMQQAGIDPYGPETKRLADIAAMQSQWAGKKGTFTTQAEEYITGEGRRVALPQVLRQMLTRPDLFGRDETALVQEYERTGSRVVLQKILDMVPSLEATMSTTYMDAVDAFQAMIDLAGDKIVGQIDETETALIEQFGIVGDNIVDAIEVARDALIPALDNIVGRLDTLIENTITAAVTIPGVGGGTAGDGGDKGEYPFVGEFQTGGYVRRTGYGLLHAGEYVSRGRLGGITVQINGDIYGMEDLENKIKATVRDTFNAGGFAFLNP